MTTREAQAELNALLPKESEAWFALEAEIADWNSKLAIAQNHVTEIIRERRDRLTPHEKRWLPLRQRKEELKAFLKLNQ